MDYDGSKSFKFRDGTEIPAACYQVQGVVSWPQYRTRQQIGNRGVITDIGTTEVDFYRPVFVITDGKSVTTLDFSHFSRVAKEGPLDKRDYWTRRLSEITNPVDPDVLTKQFDIDRQIEEERRRHERMAEPVRDHDYLILNYSEEDREKTNRFLLNLFKEGKLKYLKPEGNGA